MGAGFGQNVHASDRRTQRSRCTSPMGSRHTSDVHSSFLQIYSERIALCIEAEVSRRASFKPLHLGKYQAIRLNPSIRARRGRACSLAR